MFPETLWPSLLCIIHQFLREFNLIDACHEFERVSGIYFDISYFENLINSGAWDELEHYLLGFTSLQSNPLSDKLFYEISEQKKFEALDRSHLRLVHRDSVPKSRSILVDTLRDVVWANPDLNDKLVLPQAGESRLVALARQSLEAQFANCKCPKDPWLLLNDHQCPQQCSAYPLVNATPEQHPNPSSSRTERTDAKLVSSELAVSPFYASGTPQRASAEAASHCTSARRKPVGTSSRPHPDAINKTKIATAPAVPPERASTRKKPLMNSVSRPSTEATGIVRPPSVCIERTSGGATSRCASAAKTLVARPLKEAKTDVERTSISLECASAKATPRHQHTLAQRMLVSRRPPRAITGNTLLTKHASSGTSLDIAMCTPLQNISPQTRPETSVAVPSSLFVPPARESCASTARDGGARQRKRLCPEENVDSLAEANTSERPGGVSKPELPGPVARTLNQGSKIRSMDFHPFQQTLLLVGSVTGKLTLWAVKDPRKLVSREFNIWSQKRGMERLMADMTKDKKMSVNQVRWSRDGALAGVAYSKGLVQLFGFDGDKMRPHLQIEAHLSNVNDVSFTKWGGRTVFVTGGDDKLVKVWEASNGNLLKTFEGHEASVLCVLPSPRDDQNRLLSTSLDRKLKVWSLEREAFISERPIGLFASVQYSTDGERLFSCNLKKTGKCVVAQLDEREYKTTKTYFGIKEKVGGQVHFHSAQNRILAVGHNSKVKYWDVEDSKMLHSVDGMGELETNPVICFNKDGSLLAATTKDNNIKILVGGLQGISLLNDINIMTPLSAQLGHASTSTQVGPKSQS